MAVRYKRISNQDFHGKIKINMPLTQMIEFNLFNNICFGQIKK